MSESYIPKVGDKVRVRPIVRDEAAPPTVLLGKKMLRRDDWTRVRWTRELALYLNGGDIEVEPIGDAAPAESSKAGPAADEKSKSEQPKDEPSKSAAGPVPRPPFKSEDTKPGARTSAAPTTPAPTSPSSGAPAKED